MSDLVDILGKDMIEAVNFDNVSVVFTSITAATAT